MLSDKKQDQQDEGKGRQEGKGKEEEKRKEKENDEGIDFFLDLQKVKMFVTGGNGGGSDGGHERDRGGP